MGMFDVFSKVTGGGESEESPPDASDDGSEGAAATAGTEGVRPADCTPEDFRERAAMLADRSDVPELDFSEAALADVDAMATGNHPVDDELTYGSYLGETLVREYGGEWVRDDGWGVRVALGDDETTVAVFDAARMALDGRPVFEGVAARLHDHGGPDAEGTGESTTAADATGTGGDATATEGDATATEDDATTADHEAADEGVDGRSTTDEELDERDGADEAESGVADATEPEVADEVVESDASDDAEPDDVAAVDLDEDDAEDIAAPESVDTAASTGWDATEATSDATEADDDSSESEDVGPLGEDEPAADVADAEGDPAGGDADVGDVTEGDDETVTPEDDAPASTADETSASATTGGDDRAVEREAEPDRSRSETTADAVDADTADGVADAHGTPASSDGDDGTDPTTVETDGPLAATDDDGGEDGSVVDARSSDLGLGDDGPTEGDLSRSPLAGREQEAGGRDGDHEGDGDGEADDGEVAPLDETADDGDGDGEADDEEGADGGAAAVDDPEDGPTSEPGDGPDYGFDRDARVESGDDAATDARSGAERVEEGGDLRDEPAGVDEFEDDRGDVAVDEEDEVDATTENRSTAESGNVSGVEPDDAAAEGDAAVTSDDGVTAEERTGADAVAEDADAAVEVEATPDDDADANDVGTSEDVGVSDDVEASDDPEASGVGATGASGPTRDDYEAPAIEFRNAWQEREFDFTPASLARLDSFLDDQWDGRFRRGSLDGAATAPDEGSGPLLRVGAYVGEVLVQHYDGEWIAGEDGDPAVAVPGRHGRRETFPVFGVVRTSLVENARVAYAVDAMANRLDLETHASGAEETGFALGEAGPGTRASSADVITTILDRAEAFVAAWPGYDLDYRPASLVRLDNLVERELDGEAFRAATLGERTDADALRLADHAAGASAYFAAVLVRHLDAQWEIGADVALAVEGPAGETRVVPFDGSVACLRGEDSFMRRYDRVHDAVERESRTPE